MSVRTLARRHGLRWSMFAAAGIIPIACSGERAGDGSPGGGGKATAGAGGKSVGASKPGGSAGAQDVAGGGAGGVPGASEHGCTKPVLNPLSGLVSCAEGYEHRPSAVACALSDGGASTGGPAGGAGGAEGGTEGGSGQLPRVRGDVSCFHNEAACDAFELGYCEDDSGGGGNPAVCFSGCIDDQDCGDGFVCICDGPSPTGGKCHRSDCTTDADCDDGFLCASYSVACGYAGFSCQRATDECTKDDDCEFGYCSFNGEHRQCDNVACGRPFLVESHARVAPAVVGGASLTDRSRSPRVEHLTAAARAALAAHWTRMGQMEHASIAAFARFALQLLSLGAPPELVEDCTRAMADETAHTRLCFELASAYAGHTIGPGPLDVDGSLAVTSLTDIVDLVIVEGCFGETRAALEALEAADAETDPIIRAAYQQIARDEERHAALAFRFLCWALTRDPEAVAARLALASEAPTTEPLARDVVVPCLRALQGARPSCELGKSAQDDGPVQAELAQKGAVVAGDHEPAGPALERAGEGA